MFAFLDQLASNSGLTLLLSSVALALLCAVICFSVVRGRMPARQIFSYICKAIVAVAAAAAVGFLASLIPAKGIWSQVVFYATLAVAVIAAILVYVIGLKGALRRATANSLRASAANTAGVRHAKGWLFGTCVALIVVSAVFLALGYKYYLPMFAVAVVAVCALLCGIVRVRLWYALCAIVIAAFAVSVLLPFVITPQGCQLPLIAGALLATVFILMACVTLTIRKE